MTSLIKFVLVFAIVATTNAQICCNLDQECSVYDQVCRTDTQCYWDARFANICDEPVVPDLKYKCFPDQTSFWKAEEFCNGKGGKLARKALRQPNMVEKIRNTDCAEHTWAGFRKVGDLWVWIDEDLMNPETVRWSSGEPNNESGNEACAEINSVSNGILLLNDVACNLNRRILCEFEV